MLALIMAGGKGSRLNLGEKPLVTVAGRPMIAYVIRAFEMYGCNIVAVVSEKTPMTQNWCRVSGIDLFCAKGNGYVKDMVDAVSALGEKQPVFISVSDIPCLHAGILEKIHAAYEKSGKESCSSWVPVSLVRNHRDVLYKEKINGIEACPCGVNILRGDLIAQPQDEFSLLLDEPRLAYNVNTRTDLAFADMYLKDPSHAIGFPRT
ncbi:MAG: NTP transferase domain-containing protein [Methanoregula sp.]|nr:MAG: NTP transferase domain-containing protein [Methanoregula sp.]